MNEQPATTQMYTYQCPSCNKELQVEAGATSVFCVSCKNWSEIVRETPESPDNN